ncbi:MAG: branched-chain amino acid transport system II carrier protein [Chlamydiota bacterium]|nr:branched-chain amino acid transport system II carrier protein [Chlamydiota bacterium]
MRSIIKSKTFSTGLAMFAMFFGAGNSIFPLMIGYQAQDKTLFAIFGLLLTAVLVPFAGLIGMILFDGDYNKFFERIGRVPGYLVAILIMMLLGPFGATPRCIAMSFSTLKVSFPGMNAELFSAIACCVVFAFTIKKNRILDLIGLVLTPILVVFLGIIIVKGLLFNEGNLSSSQHGWSVFINGLQEGYNTMDLLGAFFFAPVILAGFRKGSDPENCPVSTKRIFRSAIYASYIGAFLLTVTYIGFCYIASFHGHGLEIAGPDELIGAIAVRIIGPSAGVIASMIVSLACLTTAIALTTVFAEFFQSVICRGKIAYEVSLVLTLMVTYLFSTLEFSGIAAFLVPILQVCYPALIVLTFFNIMNRLGYFQTVKRPVFFTFAASLLSYFWL